jgi:hypothetical protein
MRIYTTIVPLSLTHSEGSVFTCVFFSSATGGLAAVPQLTQATGERDVDSIPSQDLLDGRGPLYYQNAHSGFLS